MSTILGQALAVAVVAWILVASVFAQNDPRIAFVQVANAQQRLRYLATARIWSDPGALTPEMVLAGRPLPGPSRLDAALRGEPLECRFARPGRVLGGNTPKFACLTPDGRMIRVKYSDGSGDDNREIFSAVVAARLLWALGFESDPIYPITIDCPDCPADPMSGTGRRARRSYLATFQPIHHQLVMVDGTNPNQGWSWAEVDEAIDRLPEGPVRARQRAQFDALTLVAVFLQHGDRKPEQQRLECRDRLDPSAGDVHPLSERDSHAYSAPVFFEHAGATACGEPAIAVQDVGATFGGAGRMSKSGTAKMSLHAWSARPVFHAAATRPESGVPECRGALTVSMTAGAGGRGNPRIREAGRAFLADRLQRLTDAHVRALMTTGRVDKLSDPQVWVDRAGVRHSGLEAWVAAFTDKVRQISERRCAE